MWRLENVVRFWWRSKFFCRFWIPVHDFFYHLEITPTLFHLYSPGGSAILGKGLRSLIHFILVCTLNGGIFAELELDLE